MRLIIAVLLALSSPFSTSEVLKTFDKCTEFFSEGQPPVIPGILDPNFDHACYKKICQKYSLANVGSGYTFATLYDTERRIPVFSAYKYTGRGNFRRPRVQWKIEPQLDPHVAGMTLPYNNQAINEDYFRNPNYQVNRGHLFPSCHTADEFIAQSTFTLTNIVPQHITFNNGSWNRMEIKSQDSMNTHCFDNNDKVKAHVLTGAIPGKNKLNGRVNIPSHMWMAFCCYNSRKRLWVSEAYWAKNQQESANENKEIRQKTVQDLQQYLSQNWVKNVQLFKNCN